MHLLYEYDQKDICVAAEWSRLLSVSRPGPIELNL